jgi:hypothetical protein
MVPYETYKCPYQTFDISIYNGRCLQMPCLVHLSKFSGNVHIAHSRSTFDHSCNYMKQTSEYTDNCEASHEICSSFIQSRGSLLYSCDWDWCLFSASSIQSTFYFFKSPLNITVLFMYSTSSGLFQDFNLNFVRTFHHIHASYMTRPSWNDHPNYIWWRVKIRNSLLCTYLHIPTTSSSANCAYPLTFIWQN